MAKYKFIKDYTTKVGIDAVTGDIKGIAMFKTLNYKIDDTIDGTVTKEAYGMKLGGEPEPIKYRDVLVVENIYKTELPTGAIKKELGQSRYSIPLEYLEEVKNEKKAETTKKPMSDTTILLIMLVVGAGLGWLLSRPSK